MKKIVFTAAILMAATALASAQNMYDAITFSQNEYLGTARSLSMGNAVTALGGDLGSVGINPAGSAVAGYGQFVITPGLAVSSVSSAYSQEGERAFGMPNYVSEMRMNLPNVGLSMTYTTGRRTGVKGISFALVSNQTNAYNYAAEGIGSNSRTSMIAEYANGALGYPESILSAYNSFHNSDVPWDLLTAYQAGMFGTYRGDGEYAGVTETISDDGDYHYVPGALSQMSCLAKRGSKRDLVFNTAVNISDRVYVGFNIGMPMARYRYSESFYETAANKDLFPIVYEDDGQEYTTYFNSGVYNYEYLADMVGVYAKIGIIVRPAAGVRLGATFQTPTLLTISESWQYGAATYYSDNYYNDSVTSPTGEYSYMLRTPYRASFGVAYALGKMGCVSVDYELADYSVMRFRGIREERLMGDSFTEKNWMNRYFCGVSHALRIGAELKVTPEFAVRAGYTMTTSPERWWTDSEGKQVDASTFMSNMDNYIGGLTGARLVTPHYYADRTRSFSFGLGYSSGGSFFMDAAVRCTRYPATTFAPYYDYLSYDSNGTLAEVEAPRLLNQRILWNAALTFGWRF